MENNRDQALAMTAADDQPAPITTTTQVARPVNSRQLGAIEQTLHIEPLVPTCEACQPLQSSQPAPSFYQEHESTPTWISRTTQLKDRKQLEVELQTSEKRLHDALNSLLAMAEALVLSPEENGPGAYTTPTANEVARRLAELTRDMLECQGVGIFALEPHSNTLLPMAVTGPSQAQEQQWWTTPLQQNDTLATRFTPEMIAQLHTNEVLTLDMQQSGCRELFNPYATRFMRIAPMKSGKQLIGLLILDYGATEQGHSAQETAFIKAVSKLTVLVIERKRLLYERAQAQANELAQREANRRMEEFLGIASHELRTPLTTINVHIQMVARLLKRILEQDEPDVTELMNKSAVLQDMLGSAGKQIEVLNRLVNDLIDISRIQANKLVLHIRPEPCDLAHIVWEAVRNQRYIAPEREILLKMACPETALLQEYTGQPLAPVLADADRIGQVVSNYLTNALKYSPPDRPIEVHLRVTRKQVRVSVKDHGPGLTPEEQERIWERFYQVERLSAQQKGGAGLGLGLHISQSIIERHQGQIGIKSTPGKGSTFWFTLPLVRLTAPHRTGGAPSASSGNGHS